MNLSLNCAEEPLVKVAKVTRTVSNEASKPVRTVSITAEDPVTVGPRPPSPARRPESNVIHVTGLVRPYTISQLKELLGRTGTLVDDGFWIDSIKSHCYVVVCTPHLHASFVTFAVRKEIASVCFY